MAYTKKAVIRRQGIWGCILAVSVLKIICNGDKFWQQEVITDVLDQEQHVVDILVETRLADEEGIILIHVEIQAQYVLKELFHKVFKNEDFQRWNGWQFDVVG